MTLTFKKDLHRVKVSQYTECYLVRTHRQKGRHTHTHTHQNDCSTQTIEMVDNKHQLATYWS